MNQENHDQIRFQLETKSILNVPLQIYEDDFTFFVNGEEIKTSRIVADLLSPKICLYHRTDPTMDKIIINTEHRGHFSHILDLVKFDEISIPANEYLFFIEVLEILENDLIHSIRQFSQIKLTEDNVIEQMKEHAKHPFIYSNELEEEVKFIAKNFFKICEEHKSSLKTLSSDILYKIISKSELHLKDEDQLLIFLNEINEERQDYDTSNLYEFVIFSNVESKTVEEFVRVYDYQNLTSSTWSSISDRLKLPIKEAVHNIELNDRYEKQLGTEFIPQNDNEFNGIMKHLRNESNDKIENKINITTSSFRSDLPPSNVVIYEDRNKYFMTNNSKENNWICFDFKDKRVNLTHYQMMSCPWGENSYHPKSWSVEGSNDFSKWEKLDERTNDSHLRGNCLSHLFNISNPTSNDFRYIRIRLTGADWYINAPYYYLSLNAVEFYGNLI